MLDVLAGIAWDPTIRGLLSVAVGVVVLMGSVYLLLATNTGTRLGFLIAAAGFFGWMVIMGIIWWIYGIGLLGESPSWEVVEYNRGDLAAAETEKATELDLSAFLEELGDYSTFRELESEDPLGAKELADPTLPADWEVLSLADPARGEAEATVSAELPGFGSLGIEAADDYIVLAAFETGGKAGLPDDPTVWDRVWTKIRTAVQIKNPTRYALVQVREVVEQEVEPGEAPPTPIADEDAPVISVVMVRDIGDRRFPAAVTTVGSLLIFLVLCYVLHQREKVLIANKERAAEVAAAN